MASANGTPPKPDIEVSPLQEIWKDALQEYTTQLRKVGHEADLEKWTDVRDVDDLFSRLETEHGTFDKDVGRGSKFTKAVKLGLGPLTLLLNTLGGAASAAFAPCSQILGAVTVLISAGKKTVCGLATRRTYHVSEKAKHRSVKQVLSGVQSNVEAFGRQLFLGEDADIEAAKANLRTLTTHQAQLVGVLTLEKVGDIQEDMTQIGAVAIDIQGNTARMESVVVSIKGMNVVISSAVVELEAHVSGMKTQLQDIGGVISKVEFKVDDIRENMVTKADIADMKDSVAQAISQQIGQIKPSGQLSTARTPKTELSKTAVMHSKRLQQLRDRLDPAAANRNLYERIVDGELLQGTGDWILKTRQFVDWLSGEQALMCISGEPGCGKTFLAAASSSTCTRRTSKKCLGLLPCQLDISSLKVAQNDSVYASHIDGKTKEIVLGSCDVETLWQRLFVDYFADNRGSVYLVLDDLWACQSDDVKALLSAFKLANTTDPVGWPSGLRLLLLHNFTATDDVWDAFGEKAKHLNLEKSDIMSDLTVVVQKKMEDAWNAKWVTAELFDSVKNAALSGQLANFQLCCLVVDDLTALSREDVIRERLQCLPTNISDAMLLILRRLSQRLDHHAMEDLNDLLAWVECSHKYLSLTELDAILALRKPGGARVIDLDDLITNTFAGLFITATNDNTEDLRSGEIIRRRLQSGRHEVASVIDRTTVNNDDADEDLGIFPPVANGDKSSPLDRRIAAWSRMTVRLTHPLVQHYIAMRAPAEDLKIDTARMYSNVLLGCLRNLCEPDPTATEDVIKRANSYCALYLPEQLYDVDPDSADAETKRTVARLLLRLLREDDIIDRWISFAALTMVQDLLNKSEFQEKVILWLQAADSLDEHETQWVEQAVASPVAVLFEPLARRLGLVWLDQDEQEYFIYPVHFLLSWLPQVRTIYHSPLLKVLTTSQALGQKPDLEGMVRSTELYGLEGQALQILQTARWCGHDRSAHFFQRVGDALRHEDFGLRDAAKSMYTQGLTLDTTSHWLHLGYVHSWSTLDDVRKDSASHANKAVELCRERLTNTSLSQKDRSAATALLWYALSQSSFIHKAVEDWDKCNESFESLLKEWESADVATANEYFVNGIVGAVSYFDSLHQQARYSEAIHLLERLIAHPDAHRKGFCFIYTESIKPESLSGFSDILIPTAYHSNRFEPLDEFWTSGIQVCARYARDGVVAALRFRRAQGMLRLRPARIVEATLELQSVVDDAEISALSNEFHWVRESAEVQLARVYLHRALQARELDRWQQVGSNIDELVRLTRTLPGTEQTDVVSRQTACILASWNRLNGQPARAMQCAKQRLEHGIKILTDSDPFNDYEAWTCIGDACLVVGDVERAAAAVAMTKQLSRYGAAAIEGVTQVIEDDSQSTVPKLENEVVGESEAGERDDGFPKEDDTSIATIQYRKSAELCTGANDGLEQDDQIIEAQPTAMDGAAVDPDNTGLRQDGSASNTHEGETGDGDEDEDEHDDANLLWGCDGPCFKAIPSKDMFYRCGYCLADLCEACSNKISNQTLEGFTVRFHSHERHAMPALHSKFEPGCLEYKGESVSIATWLQDLKEEWGIVGA